MTRYCRYTGVACEFATEYGYCKVGCIKRFGNPEQLGKDHFADPGNMVGDLISRQANCDYCHEDSDGYVRPIEKNAHAVLFMGVLRIKGYGHKWDVKINYCPMCGRELRHG